MFFDVGETLVDEERWWRALAERSGLRPHVIWVALGITIGRGEEHNALRAHLRDRAANRLVERAAVRPRRSLPGRDRCRRR